MHKTIDFHAELRLDQESVGFSVKIYIEGQEEPVCVVSDITPRYRDEAEMIDGAFRCFIRHGDLSYIANIEHRAVVEGARAHAATGKSDGLRFLAVAAQSHDHKHKISRRVLTDDPNMAV